MGPLEEAALFFVRSFIVSGSFQSGCGGKSDEKYLWEQKNSVRYFLSGKKVEEVSEKYLGRQKSSVRYFF